MNLIILGPPGSGKGTQSQFLVDKYHFTHLSTGDLLRDEINKVSVLGMEVKSYIEQGRYVPDETINMVISKNLKPLHDYIFDGYPRTINQVKFLETNLAKIGQKIDLVIYLDINEEVLKTRLLSRLYCPKCKRTYNKKFLAPKNNNCCDYDNTKLVIRSDDSNLTKIKTRFKEYDMITKPLVTYFKSQNNLVVINANEDNKIIQNNLITILKAKQYDYN